LRSKEKQEQQHDRLSGKVSLLEFLLEDEARTESERRGLLKLLRISEPELPTLPTEEEISILEFLQRERDCPNEQQVESCINIIFTSTPEKETKSQKNQSKRKKGSNKGRETKKL